MKRTFDVAISTLLLAVLSPLLIAIATAVRLRLGSPVIYQQERPGLNKRPFSIWKFRTMTDAVNADGALLPDKDRLTPFGSFLRSTSMDELPELFNVLRGEMSLVGPRPLLMRYLPYYKVEELSRFSVRPGITGWAQVNGRNNAGWDDRLSMDAWYVANRSILLDLKILALTVQRVATKKDLVPDPSSVMLDLDVERDLS